MFPKYFVALQNNKIDTDKCLLLALNTQIKIN